jgi:hypothetical protein
LDTEIPGVVVLMGRPVPPAVEVVLEQQRWTLQMLQYLLLEVLADNTT